MSLMTAHRRRYRWCRGSDRRRQRALVDRSAGYASLSPRSMNPCRVASRSPSRRWRRETGPRPSTTASPRNPSWRSLSELTSRIRWRWRHRCSGSRKRRSVNKYHTCFLHNARQEQEPHNRVRHFEYNISLLKHISRALHGLEIVHEVETMFTMFNWFDLAGWMSHIQWDSGLFKPSGKTPSMYLTSRPRYLNCSSEKVRWCFDNTKQSFYSAFDDAFGFGPLTELHPRKLFWV